MANETIYSSIWTLGPNYIYLASPYSATGPNATALMDQRYALALSATEFLLRHFGPTFSPVVYGHHLARRFSLPWTWDYWRPLAEAFIRSADSIFVLDLGKITDVSLGVNKEIEIARRRGLPIYLLRPEADDATYFLQLA